MARIRELDGLRAIAVGMVVLGHTAGANPDSFPTLAKIFLDGRLGVLLFFVLSGFLITSALVKEKEQGGTISLAAFYTKRAIRILPASYFYIAVISAFALAGDLRVSTGQILVALGHLWNYGHFILGNGAPEQGGKVLGHFWSLAIEEQFYWFWPLILLTLRRGFTPFLIAVVALSPLLRIAQYFLVPETRPYLTMMFHSGADALAIGALLAVERTRISQVIASASPAMLSLPIAAFFLVIPVIRYFIEGIWSVTYGRTVESVIAAVIILTLIERPDFWLSRLCRLKPFQFIGAISFSLYLWQQAFCMEDSLATLPPVAAIAASVAAATASYYLIEQPAHRRRDTFLSLLPTRRPKTA